VPRRPQSLLFDGRAILVWRYVLAEETGNVFVSHVHEDDAGLTDLKSLVASKGFNLRDSSITSDKPNNATSPEYIKSEILAPKIQWAGTVVVYLSSDTCQSEWVNWEIEYAHKLGKRIVGVWARGENGCDIPEALEKYADAVVGWNSDSIIDAIKGNKDSWTTPSGEPRPERLIPHYSCH
jgi:hypothetical protein